jgi:hypothetical protein
MSEIDEGMCRIFQGNLDCKKPFSAVYSTRGSIANVMDNSPTACVLCAGSFFCPCIEGLLSRKQRAGHPDYLPNEDSSERLIRRPE